MKNIWDVTLEASIAKIEQQVGQREINKHEDDWEDGYTQALLDVLDLLRGDADWLDENFKPLGKVGA